MKKVERMDMSVPSGDSIMRYERSGVAERVARNTAHDSKLAAQRMAMLDDGHRFLYGSLVACALGQRLQSLDTIKAIASCGPQPVVQDTRKAASEVFADASEEDSCSSGREENDEGEANGEQIISQGDEAVKGVALTLAGTDIDHDELGVSASSTWPLAAKSHSVRASKHLRKKKPRQPHTSIADSYQTNLAENKVADAQPLPPGAEDQKRIPVLLNLSDEDWAERYLDSLVQCLELSEQHCMVVHMSYKTRVPPETFAEELCNTPEISLAIMQDLVMLSVYEGAYDARSRGLVRYVTSLMRLSWTQAELFENQLAHYLRDRLEDLDEELDDERHRLESRNRMKRYAYGTSAAVAGAVIIGVTAGVAAPVFAAGTGVLLGASVGAFFASQAGIALTTTLFTGVGLGLGAYAAYKRLADLKHFNVLPLFDRRLPQSGNYLHVMIFVSGLADTRSDYSDPWRNIEETGERYAIEWEFKEIRRMSNVLRDILLREVPVHLVQKILELTVLSVLSAMTMPLWLTKLTYLLDHPWARCLSRADKAAIVLADILAKRIHGNRPVVLVGTSFGARMIFMALENLANRKVPVTGVVDTVYLLGAPVPADPQRWAKVASIVGGEVFNCYSRTDWILGMMYRTANLRLSVAGITPVEGIPNVHNIDLTSDPDLDIDLVYDHDDYRENLHAILYRLGLTREPPPPPEIPSLLPSLPMSKETSRSTTPSLAPPGPENDEAGQDTGGKEGRPPEDEDAGSVYEEVPIDKAEPSGDARASPAADGSASGSKESTFLKRLRDKLSRPRIKVENLGLRDLGDVDQLARKELEADSQWEIIRAEIAATALDERDLDAETNWIAYALHRARRLKDTPDDDALFDKNDIM